MQNEKRHIWKLAIPVILPLLLLVFGLFFCRRSSGFHIDEIRPGADFSFQITNNVAEEDLYKLRGLFSEPFNYLDECDQFYTFVSENEEYVLKFFKIKRFTPKYWLNAIPLPWLDSLRLYKISERERLRQETFGSFKIAFEEFRHQTGLVFLHLFRTNFLKMKVELSDQKRGIHAVELDAVPFVLQKKTMLLSEYIEKLLVERREKEAVGSLRLVLDLVKDRCQKGFSVRGEEVTTDYGFVDGRPVLMDVGRMSRDDALKSPLNILREVFRVGKQMEVWLTRSHPFIVPEFQNEEQDLLDFLEEV